MHHRQSKHLSGFSEYFCVEFSTWEFDDWLNGIENLYREWICFFGDGYMMLYHAGLSVMED